MKNDSATLVKKSINIPYEITQAVIGVEASKTDKSILKYFNFFTKNIPTSSAFFIHAETFFKKFEELKTEDFYQDEMTFFNNQIENKIQNDIEKHFPQKDKMYVESYLKNGDPLEILLDTAEDLNADLVVIGQKKGTKHHGILAKNFARKTKGNALVIPEKSKCKITTILVPVDFSENSARALQTAISIQKQLKKPAKLIELNVFELPNFSSFRITKSRSKFKANIKEQVKGSFTNFLKKYAPEEMDQIEMQLLFKDSSNLGGYIYSFAADHKVDFMVMGAKGHSKLELFLMGSVTEKVLSLNHTFPTLIVK